MKIELTQEDLTILCLAYEERAKVCKSNAEYMKGYPMSAQMAGYAERFEKRAKHFEEIAENFFQSNAKDRHVAKPTQKGTENQ